MAANWRDYAERRTVAAHIRAVAPAVAVAVTDEFFERHPEWLKRYGRKGVERGIEDAGFHIDFLAGAIECGSAEAFGEYLQWAARVLMTRNIRPESLIENVEQVRNHLLQRLGGQDATAVREVVDEAIRDFDATAATGAEPVLDAAREVYVNAALAGHRVAALNIARQALREGAQVPDVYCDLLQPAQYAIGKLWETNAITVAQEHLATAVTQYVVAQLYADLPIAAERRGNLVVTGVQGELHQLGANMLADVLEAEGWNVRFLGTQLPHKDILHFAEQHEADVLAISVTMLFNARRAAELIEDAQARLGSALRIVVGGSAFRMNDRLWREIGAHGSANDLRDGIALINSVTW